MYTIGLDLHQRQSTICILDSAGKLVKQQQIRGGVKELVKQLRSVSPPFQICYEASWVRLSNESTRRWAKSRPGRARPKEPERNTNDSGRK